VELSPLRGAVEVDRLVVSNPASYPRPEFLTINTFEADVNLLSISREAVVLDSLILDIETFALVVPEEGLPNAASFAEGLRQGMPASDAEAEAEPEETTPAESTTPLHISRLVLRLDDVIVLDESGLTDTDRTYSIDFNYEAEDATDLRDALTALAAELPPEVALALLGVLGQTLGELDYLDMLPSDLMESEEVTELLGDLEAEARSAAEQLGDALNDIFDTFRD